MNERFGSYAWLKFGSKRRVVVAALVRDDMFPCQISRGTMAFGKRVTLCNLSGTLKELTKAGIIICTDSSVVRGRPYSLTPKGKAFQARLRTEDYFKKDSSPNYPQSIPNFSPLT